MSPAPARILDTRSPSVPLGPAEARTLQITGAGGVPADATAVLMNVTITSPTATSFLTAYPSDVVRPLAANLNYVAGQDPVPNLVTVNLGATGAVKLYNNAGRVHVIVDVGGYFRGHTHDDRYYVKAQAQARLAGNSLTCPPGQFLASVAADGTPTCGVGATGPQGAQGAPGPAGPSWPKGWTSISANTLPASGTEAFRIVTALFVVPAGVTSCLVTSTVQMDPEPTAANNQVYVRNAATRNGVNEDDGQYGHYVTNDGTDRKQPPFTRSSAFSVTAGQLMAFGVVFGSLAGTWFGAPYSVTTAYLCS